MAKRKELEPLIPLDDLKKVLAQIVAAPKNAIKGKSEAEPPAPRKSPRKRKSA